MHIAKTPDIMQLSILPNKMRKILILLIIITALSCEKETTFTKLPKHSETGKYDRDDERKGKKYVYQSVLVNNPPRDEKTLEKMLYSYHQKNKDSIFLDIEVITFYTYFYLRNSRTSYFIDNADDPGGFSSEILSDYYKKYGIAEINTKRIENTKRLKTELLLQAGNKTGKQN